MNLPDFSEFAASVDREKFGAELNSNIPPYIIQLDLNDRASVEKAITLCYQKTLADAGRITMLQLRAYHEWLQTQLQ